MVIGVGALNTIAQVVEGIIAVIHTAPTPVDMIAFIAIPTVEVEAVPHIAALVAGVDHTAAALQLFLQQLVPSVVAAGIVVAAITYTRLGKPIECFEIIRNIISNGSRPVSTILHVDEHAAVIEQPSHLGIVIGSRQDSVPVVIGLLVEIHAQTTAHRRGIGLGACSTQRIPHHTQRLSHGHGHTTHIGTAAGASVYFRAQAVIRNSLIPCHCNKRLDTILSGTGNNIAVPTVMTLGERIFTDYLYLVGVLLQPIFDYRGLFLRLELAIERIAQQGIDRILGRNQCPAAFFETDNVINRHVAFHHGFHAGVSALERGAASLAQQHIGRLLGGLGRHYGCTPYSHSRE